VGDPVQIATAGLIQAGHDMTGITVKFGKAGASPGTLSTVTTTSFGVLITAVVPPGAAGTVDVTVSVPNAKPILWPGFKVLPRIVRAQNLVVRRGERFVVQTVGVTGLAHSGDLAVRIGGAPALSAMNGTGELEVSVPEGAPTGETTLEVATPGGIDHAPITVNARSGVADGADSVLVASAHTNDGNESV
jgi:hypothetical protein